MSTDILTVHPSRISGNFTVPGSKSHTVRALVAGMAAEGVSVIRNPLASADTVSVADAVVKFGARIERGAGAWQITGCGGRFKVPDGTVDLGNSGTGLRLLTAMAALIDGETGFDGDASLRSRPMEPLFAALRQLGAEVSSPSGRAPFRLRGAIRGGRARVRGTSSQYLSALLFACPLCGCDMTELEVVDLCEVPYVDITLAWLKRLGVRLTGRDDDSFFAIPGRQKFQAFDAVMPGDFSTAAFPLAAGLLAGADGGVTLKNLDFGDAQGDKAVFEMLKNAGGSINISDAEVTVRNSRRSLRPGVFNLNATPDALPVLAALFASLPAESRFVDVAQARNKECDRISAMALELRKMGAVVEEFPDGMSVKSPPDGLTGSSELDSHGDHRIAMALACAALAARGASRIRGIGDAAVTYPGFTEDFRRAGADFTVDGAAETFPAK